MKSLPASVERYKQTPEFDENSIPPGLLRAHKTKAGTWGKIVIIQGQLLYRILEPSKSEVILSPDQYGVVEPQVLHEVSPLGQVKFYVEFHRA